jgi:LysM repeat protein
LHGGAQRHLCCAPSLFAGCGTVVIKAGDTFEQIAKAKGLDTAAVVAANPGVKPEALQIGQTVNLPC